MTGRAELIELTGNVRPSGARRLTLPIAAGLVAGTMVGSGVFLLPSVLAPYGTMSLVGFAVTAVGALLVALVFASLAARRPALGGPYAYVHEAFGPFAGFQAAWSYWISAWIGVGAIAVAFAGYVGALAPAVSESRGAQAGVAAVAILALTAVNLRGIYDGGLVSAVLAVAKLTPLAALAVAGIVSADTTLLGEWNPSERGTLTVVGLTAALTLWAFLGLETASVPADDVARPTRTIPLVTVAGTAVVAVLYLAVTVAVFGLVPVQTLAASQAPLADAAELVVGGWGFTAVAVAGCIATLGAMNGLILVQGQVVRAAAEDGLAPRPLGRLSRTGVPDRALVLSSTLAAVLAVLAFAGSTLVEAFTRVILIATLSALVPFAFTAAAQLKLLVVDRAPAARWVLPVTVLAFAYTFAAIAGAGREVVYYGFLLLLAGIPVYALVLRANNPR